MLVWDVRKLISNKELGVNIHAFSETKGLITPKNSKYTEVEANINNIKINIQILEIIKYKWLNLVINII